MWDFLTKKCGIFGIEGGTKLWDFQHQGGDFRPLTSGHTGDFCIKNYYHQFFVFSLINRPYFSSTFSPTREHFISH